MQSITQPTTQPANRPPPEQINQATNYSTSNQPLNEASITQPGNNSNITTTQQTVTASGSNDVRHLVVHSLVGLVLVWLKHVLTICIRLSSSQLLRPEACGEGVSNIHASPVSLLVMADACCGACGVCCYSNNLSMGSCEQEAEQRLSWADASDLVDGGIEDALKQWCVWKAVPADEGESTVPRVLVVIACKRGRLFELAIGSIGRRGRMAAN